MKFSSVKVYLITHIEHDRKVDHDIENLSSSMVCRVHDSFFNSYYM